MTVGNPPWDMDAEFATITILITNRRREFPWVEVDGAHCPVRLALTILYSSIHRSIHSRHIVRPGLPHRAHLRQTDRGRLYFRRNDQAPAIPRSNSSTLGENRSSRQRPARRCGSLRSPMTRRVLITGSSGLIGSEAVEHYGRAGWDIHGVDNNMRMDFFGSAGDTTWNLRRLLASGFSFRHHDIDIRNREAVAALLRAHRYDLIIHCAAQPSHDKAGDIPFIDFDVNAMGTLNLLEAYRQHASNAVFIHMSTNKVYGDAPNEMPLVELPTRWDYREPNDWNGVSERCRVDQSLHSLFGASKLAADVLAQEYGRYYGLSVGIFRGGCLTGSRHSGVELHGFLSFIIKTAVRDGEYIIRGYKGKQVRDQIHASDVIAAFDAFADNPRPGEVYNIGGGRANAGSLLEVIAVLESRLGRPLRYRYDDVPRRGDHICYISDLTKLGTHFPTWQITRDLNTIITEILDAELEMRHGTGADRG